MPFKRESTAALCERARHACAESRLMVRQVQTLVATAKADADAMRDRMDADPERPWAPGYPLD
jgi:hypothetical protein